MRNSLALIAAALAVQGISARSVPSNVRSFYDRVKSGSCTGSDKLKGGFHDTDDSGACEFIIRSHFHGFKLLTASPASMVLLPERCSWASDFPQRTEHFRKYGH